jgi:hypothetical protein
MIVIAIGIKSKDKREASFICMGEGNIAHRAASPESLPLLYP